MYIILDESYSQEQFFQVHRVAIPFFYFIILHSVLSLSVLWPSKALVANATSFINELFTGF